MVEITEKIEKKVVENGEGNKQTEETIKKTKYKRPMKLEKKIRDAAEDRIFKARSVSVYKIVSLAIGVTVFCIKLIISAEPMTAMDLLILLAIVLSPEFISYLKVILSGEIETKDSRIKILEQENFHLKEKAQDEVEKQKIKEELEHEREKAKLKTELAYYRGRDNGEKIDFACEGVSLYNLANDKIGKLEKKD